MKKNLFTLLLGAAILVSFSSCNKYEESVYNEANGQIRYIWYKSNVGNPNETFTYSKKGTNYQLSQIDIVDSMNVGGLLDKHFVFSYNKDNTISSISLTSLNSSETIKFAYLDKLVKYMSYSVNDTIRMVANFYRDNEEAQKITRIVETYDSTFFSVSQIISESKLYSKFIGNYDELKDFKMANTKKLKLRCNKEVVYNGENIVYIKAVYPDLQKIVESTYAYEADVLNPYYGLCYAYNELLGFSQKSMTHKDVKTYFNGVISDEEIVVYNYYDVNQYKYPREFSYTSSKNNYIPFKTYICYRSEYKN